MAIDSGDQTWKAKYAQLSNNFDTHRGIWESNEKILCRAIVRLAMVAQGLDPAIDPQLTQVRDLVRKGVRGEKLLQQLDSLTEALIRVDRGDKPLDAGLLFQFLEYCTAGEEEKAALRQQRERYENGQFTDAKSLFFALLQAVPWRESELRRPPAAKPGILSKLFGGGRRTIECINVSALRHKMLALLDSLEIPTTAQHHADRFKEQMLADLNADNIENMEGVLNDLVGLLFAVKTNIQKEQREIEEFLSSVSGKLLELESQANGVAAITSAVAREGEAMNTAFSGHMEELRSSAQGATDLSQLKGLLHNRLDAIVRQIDGYRQRETQRVVEMEQQLQGLSSRLQDMELEAGELRTKLRAAHNSALLDPLTGLPNRGAYDERVQQEYLRWRRFGEPLSLLVWDIDHFKVINDRFGHRAGDKAIAAIGRALATGVRETDFIARYGGEEFVVLLTGADTKAAAIVAESLRGEVKSCGFNSNGNPIPITVSCGIAEFRAGDTPETAFERADQALYRAKSEGRDRCVAAA